MLRCLIRVDAGIVMGGGHLVRCTALADALKQCGWMVQFATRAEALAIMPDIPAHYPGSVTDCAGDSGDAVRIAAQLG
ncbi:MAG: hypothetical protein ACRCXM_15490, partial [Beijerinckiaceae bacterium]